MNELREQVRAWLHDVIEANGLTPNRLAHMIGKAPTTLTRVLNDANAKHTLSTPTIDAIVRVTGHAPPALQGEGGPARLPAGELDGLPIDVETGDARVDDAVRYLCQADANLSPWRLNTRALEALGYMPGDVVIVDQSALPEPGDVVVAQLYKPRGGAETLFRHYHKPFLMAAAMDRQPRPPILVDEVNAHVMGVVVATFRPRRGHLARS